jgi:hypothetical protein
VLVVTPSFAPAVRKPCEVLTIREVRKCIPSFSSPELEQHLQKFPSTQVKYCGWNLEPYHYIALEAVDYFFELSKNGHAPVDHANRVYAKYESIHLIDCLNRNVMCRRLIDSLGILLVANLSIPAWGALHSTRETSCVRFFKQSGEVDCIQLDPFWTRAIVHYSFQFACGTQAVPFSKASIVRLTIEHNAQTQEWRLQGHVFQKRFNKVDDKEPDRDPESVMTEDERAEWQMNLPQIPPSQVAEMFSASKVDNCKRFVSVREVEDEMFERRAPADQVSNV